MRHKLLTASIIVSLGLFASCKKKDDEGGGETSSDETGDKAGKNKEKKADKPAGPKVFEYASAKEFFDEYTSLDGPGVMKKYGMDSKVQVKGKVKRTITEMDESLKLWLDVSEKQWVAIGFTDKGAKAKEAKLAKDSEVTVLCKIGGGTDNYVMLTECEIK